METDLFILIAVGFLFVIALLLSLFLVSPGFPIYLKRQYESISDENDAPPPFNKIRDFRIVMITFSMMRLFSLLVLFISLTLVIPARITDQVSVWDAIIFAVVAFVVVLTSEILAEIMISRPKNRFALPLGYILIAFYYVFYFIIMLIRRISKSIVARVAPENNQGEEENVNLEQMIEEQRVRHKLEDDERKMIESIVDLHEATVREVMIPRIDVSFLDVNIPYHEAVRFINQEGYSRIPVYENTVDNIVGFLYAKDLLKPVEQNRIISIRDLLREAHFVPDSKNVTQMMREFLNSRVHVALVVDEYGGTAGLITLEDIIEEIVGEIRDEHDVEEPLYKAVSEHEGVYSVDAKINLDDLAELLKCKFNEDDNFETLGGLIFDRLGRLPEAGEEFQSDGLKIHINQVEGRRISWVRVEKLKNEGNAVEILDKKEPEAPGKTT